MASNLDFAKILNSIADKVGYKIGEQIPPKLERFLDRLLQGGQLGEDGTEITQGAHLAISKLIEFLGNVVEVRRDQIPIPGFLGNLVYEFLNEGLDAAGRGAGESQQAGNKPADKGATGTHPYRVPCCYPVGGHYHKRGCSTTPRPAPRFKGDDKVADVDLATAIKSRSPLSYDGCWGTPQETDELTRQVHAYLSSLPQNGTSAPSVSDSKPKREELKGPALFEHWEKFAEDHPDLYQDIFEQYEGASDEVQGKFETAFHGRDRYVSFSQLVRRPSKKWNHLLDMIIGRSKPAEKKPEGLLAKLRALRAVGKEIGEEEQEQFNKVFDTVGDELDGIAAKMVEKLGVEEHSQDDEPVVPVVTLASYLKRREAKREESRRRRESQPFDRFVFGFLLPIVVLVVAITLLLSL